MSKEIELGVDEVVLIKSERVLHGGTLAGYTDTLILTNKYVIYIKRNIWGKAKETKKFPLASIKMYNGKPQAVLNKAANGFPTLDIYFQTSEETFGFQSKSEVIKWCEKINEAITGEKSSIGDDTNSMFTIPGTEELARTLKATFDTYKEAFGIKTKKEDKPQTASCRCSGCGAPNTGIKGETKKCPYCGNFITFE